MTAGHDKDNGSTSHPSPLSIPLCRRSSKATITTKSRKNATFAATASAEATTKASSYVSVLDENISNVSYAGAVESWISLVNQLYRLKDDDENNDNNNNINKKKKNKNKKRNNEVAIDNFGLSGEFLPYVFKYDYVVPSSPSVEMNASSSSTPTDNENKDNEQQKQKQRHDDSYWIVRSMLQHITGSRSRGEVPGFVMDAAIRYVEKERQNQRQQLHSPQRLPRQVYNAIKEAVFLNKMILIENKTLPDTVQPKMHWTLKDTSGRKGGCACCGPEDYDEDDEEDDQDNGEEGTLTSVLVSASESQSSTSTTTTKRNNKKQRTAAAGSGYVDGKTTFAFDPAKFM